MTTLLKVWDKVETGLVYICGLGLVLGVMLFLCSIESIVDVFLNWMGWI